MNIFAKFNKRELLNKCRICILNEGSCLMDSLDVGSNVSVKSIYEACTGLKVVEEDIIPKSLCNNCWNGLSATYSFIEKCKVSDSVLHSLETVIAMEEPTGYKVVVMSDDTTIEFEYVGDDEKSMESENLNIRNTSVSDLVQKDDIEDLDFKDDMANLAINTTEEVTNVDNSFNNATESSNNTDFSNSTSQLSDVIEDQQISTDIKRKIPLEDNSKTHVCTVCFRNFERKYTLDNHMRTHTNEKPYQCHLCSSCFSSNGNLSRHLRIHTGEQPYVCDVCGKGFQRAEKLKTHKELLCAVKPPRKKSAKCALCSHCGLQFISIMKYQKHLQDSHNIIRIKKEGKKQLFHCKICNRYLSPKTSVKVHMAAHLALKDYLCTYCGRKFLTKGILETHITTHTGEKLYKCQFCHKSFSQSSTCATHEYTHTGEKPYKCKDCNKGFAQGHHLVYHMRTHTGEKLFCCNYCGRKITSKVSLIEHIRKHTGEMPYTCTNCDRAFKCNSTFRKHCKMHLEEITKTE